LTASQSLISTVWISRGVGAIQKLLAQADALGLGWPLPPELLECRDAQDAKRDIQVAVSPSLVTTAYYAPAALRPCRFATPSHARCWLRSTPANGLTACRMRLHMPSAGLGPIGPAPLRPYARAYAYRGLRALASLSMARSGRACLIVGLLMNILFTSEMQITQSWLIVFVNKFLRVLCVLSVKMV